MDGRRFLQWCLCGGLVLGAVGCKTKQQTLPDGSGTLPPQMQAQLQPPKKSLWSSLTQSTPQQPVVVDAPSPKRKPNEPMKPDTVVAIADVRASTAFDEKLQSANPEALIDAARQGYQQALQQDPKHKGAHLGLARLYARAGDQEKSMEYFRKYLSLYPKDHDIMHEIAVVHGRWKNWEGAAAWCETALKADPENRNYRKTLGFMQAHAGKWDDAFATLCQVMPEPRARLAIASALDQAGQTEACRQQLQLAIQADPAFVRAREMLAELDQGTGNANPPTTAEEANPIRQASGTQPR